MGFFKDLIKTFKGKEINMDEYKKPKEVEEPKPTEQVMGKTKTEIIECITSEAGDCSECPSTRKCNKLRNKMKKLGMIR